MSLRREFLESWEECLSVWIRCSLQRCSVRKAASQADRSRPSMRVGSELCQANCLNSQAMRRRVRCMKDGSLNAQCMREFSKQLRNWKTSRFICLTSVKLTMAVLTPKITPMNHHVNKLKKVRMLRMYTIMMTSTGRY